MSKSYVLALVGLSFASLAALPNHSPQPESWAQRTLASVQDCEDLDPSDVAERLKNGEAKSVQCRMSVLTEDGQTVNANVTNTLVKNSKTSDSLIKADARLETECSEGCATGTKRTTQFQTQKEDFENILAAIKTRAERDAANFRRTQQQLRCEVNANGQALEPGSRAQTVCFASQIAKVGTRDRQDYYDTNLRGPLAELVNEEPKLAMQIIERMERNLKFAQNLKFRCRLPDPRQMEAEIQQGRVQGQEDDISNYEGTATSSSMGSTSIQASNCDLYLLAKMNLDERQLQKQLSLGGSQLHPMEAQQLREQIQGIQAYRKLFAGYRGLEYQRMAERKGDNPSAEQMLSAMNAAGGASTGMQEIQKQTNALINQQGQLATGRLGRGGVPQEPWAGGDSGFNPMSNLPSFNGGGATSGGRGSNMAPLPMRPPQAPQAPRGQPGVSAPRVR